MSEPSPDPAAQARGRLWLMPNALDFGVSTEDLGDALPLGVIRRAAHTRHWVVEDARSARAFLKRVDALVPLCAPLQEMHINALPRPPKGQRPQPGDAAQRAQALAALLQPALQGHDIALLSEAGLPAVADPGAELVAQAHRLGLDVQALSGPSAITLALASSGLNGQGFEFLGYLPVDATARAAAIRESERRSRASGHTQVAIETPYRNTALLQALVQHLHPQTRLAVAHAVSLPSGRTVSREVQAWKRASQAGGDAGPPLADDRVPAVFMWLAEAGTPGARRDISHAAP